MIVWLIPLFFDYLPILSVAGLAALQPLQFNVIKIPGDGTFPIKNHSTCNAFGPNAFPYPNPKVCLNVDLSSCPHELHSTTNSFLQTGIQYALCYKIDTAPVPPPPPLTCGDVTSDFCIELSVCDNLFNYLGHLIINAQDPTNLSIVNWVPGECYTNTVFKLGLPAAAPPRTAFELENIGVSPVPGSKNCFATGYKLHYTAGTTLC